MGIAAASPSIESLLAAGRIEEAGTAAWAAWERSRGDHRARAAVVTLLSEHPAAAAPRMRAGLVELLHHPAVDPDDVAAAGWQLIRRAGIIDPALQPDSDEDVLADLAGALDSDPLVRALLEESIVIDPTVERGLARLRRWMLTSDRWIEFPNLVGGLGAQAALNEGAWPFDAAERLRLADRADEPIVRAYLPEPRGPDRPDADIASIGMAPDAVAGAVAAQYENRPYPRWRRISRPDRQPLCDYVRAFWPEGADRLPARPRVLVPGCGTGRHVAVLAARLSDASFTALDISHASLAYAKDRCERLGLAKIRFLHGDLRHLGRLGETFDFISCAGVLHHMSDPEAGWARLLATLAPGGVMDISVYSRLAHLAVEAARAQLSDLAVGPMNDDHLREARRRLLDLPAGHAATAIYRSSEFYSLTGVHDILFPAHKVLFDIPRLARAHDAMGLQFLGFRLPRALRRHYDEILPTLSQRRDFRTWQAIELRNPSMFRSMYHFYCCRASR